MEEAIQAPLAVSILDFGEKKPNNTTGNCARQETLMHVIVLSLEIGGGNISHQT